MKLKMFAGILGFAGAALLMTGCQTANVPEVVSPPFEGTRWELPDPVENTVVYIRFEDGKFSGHGGVNLFFGNYELEGNSITFGKLGSNMMTGPKAMMYQERTVFKALMDTVSYQIVGEQLQLMNADGNTVLTFEPAVLLTLTSNEWKAVGVNNGKGGVTSLIQGTELTAVFAEDGTVSGHSGCNQFSGGYEVDGEKIKIGPLAGTRKMCAEPEGIMEQETAFLQALEKTWGFHIEGKRLMFRDVNGALQVKFDAVVK